MRRLALVGLLAACTPAASTDAPASSKDATLEQLCGTWRSEAEDGSIVEERWWPRAGGLAGEGVTRDGSGTEVARETIELDLLARGSIYRAQPGDAPPTEFRERLAETDERGSTWEWANPEHDFPQSIRYELAGDRLQASITGPDAEGGTATLTWTFVRVADCAPATEPSPGRADVPAR